MKRVEINTPKIDSNAICFRYFLISSHLVCNEPANNKKPSKISRMNLLMLKLLIKAFNSMMCCV